MFALTGGSVAIVAASLAAINGGDGRGWLLAAIAVSVVAAAAFAVRTLTVRHRTDQLGANAVALVRETSSASIVLAPDGRVRFASATAAELLGYRRGILAGGSLRDLVAQADSAAILDLVNGPPGTRTSLDCRFRMGNGDWLSVELDVANLAADPDVAGLVVSIHDVTRWKVLEESLTQLAFHDSLTHLPNRALFIDRLEHALGRRRRHASGTAVLFVDLDDFKTVNDSLGHVEADAVLALVAERLLAAIRPEDTAGRLGGDEFAILLDDVDEEHAATVAARALAALEPPFVLAQRQIRIGGSIGIAHSAAGLTRSTDMLRAADIAMYHAKESGKNQYRLFDPSMQDASTERLSLGVDMRGAVERGEFILHYQPIVNLPDGGVVAMEALVRWMHPERGLISPLEFIAIAEKTGLMIPLGEFVVREACRQARAWQLARPGQPPVVVNVNLSGVQLQHPGLVAAVSLALEDSGLPPELLMLEITESVMARETEATARRLRQLKGLGVGLAIDDFGTGYSSLSYLRRFPIQVVKIDKSFVDGIEADASAQALARGIVQLAHSLKTTTVAEGVETEAQMKRLIRMGCDRAQGFFFARPMGAREATEYVVGRSILTLLVGHVGPELSIISSVVEDFERLNPGLRVEVVGGATDERIQAALDSDDPPTAITSFESDTFAGSKCVSKLLDLGPFMARDGIREADFTDATLAYTGDERGRWALPVLADAYGLLYNRQLFAAAGLSEPPRTIAELTDLAKRLTVRNPDGSLRIVGFDPTIGFYENTLATFGHMFGAAWQTDGRSSLSSDPAWAKLLRWQKELVDWYGAENLAAFHEQVGDEFSTNNAFQAGSLAMCLDGEWRVAFIAIEAEELDYGTAPLPVDETRPELYGSGYINGSVIGIPLNARHREAAWTLVKFLATDEAALAKLSNGLRNVPSTRTSLRSAALVPDDRFAVFLDIFGHERSASAPMTPIGSEYQVMSDELAASWQAGRVGDLEGALKRLDLAIGDKVHAALLELGDTRAA
ncbi:MAG TPA: extracellular solute-binding protein [Candidatus Limnocylindrales bacterium]|nr:extracellular solute-binding protein [Candidatus Limnocylindrales bacterium]